MTPDKPLISHACRLFVIILNGLGLAISYSIIKKHGGQISVESEVAKSTTFHIHLPASDKLLQKAEGVQLEPIPGKGRILVMDDEDIVRDTAQLMLQHLDYDVRLARDGAEAIDSYSQAIESGRPFTAVIMDLTIRGGMGGAEALAQLLKMDPAVKAIVSSGYSSGPVISNFRDYGFTAVVTKPYRIQELSEILHRVLSC